MSVRSRDYQDRVREVFAALDLPPEPRHACGERAITAAERRLGVAVPEVLRGFYRVAGRHDAINRAHNRLLPLDEWAVDGGRLLFMEENQNVVFWGVPVAAGGTDADPDVWQAENGDALVWEPEKAKLSEFLLAMLCWQAVMGGLPFARTAVVGKRFPSKLGAVLTPVGRIGELEGFARAGTAACFARWGDAEWRFFAAAHDARALDRLGKTLSLRWDPHFG
jgi:hypothetical protein